MDLAEGESVGTARVLRHYPMASGLGLPCRGAAWPDPGRGRARTATAHPRAAAKTTYFPSGDTAIATRVGQRDTPSTSST